MPSRPSGARLATHAVCRGLKTTSPMESKATHAIAAGMLGLYASQSGEIAITHMPGSMTVNASRWPVKEATKEGPSMHTHMLIECIV